MNKRLLKAKMVEHGYNDEQLSACIGINPATFYRKKNGESDFLRREIQAIRNALHLSPNDIDAIFFG